MEQNELYRALDSLSSTSQLMEVLRYTENLIHNGDVYINSGITSVTYLSYGDTNLVISDNDLGEIPWL